MNRTTHAMALVLPLLAATATGQSQTASAEGAQSIALEAKAQRNWKIDLPAPQFVTVGAGIELAGRSFAAQRQGLGLAVDTDGDGETDVVVKGTSGFVTLTDEGGFRYPVRLRNDGAGWQFASSGFVTGKLGDTRIKIIDQNNNGSYADYGVDAMVVGSSDVATFLSRAVSLGDEVWSIDVHADGAKVDASPFDGETGVLDLTADLETKAKLLSAVVRSVDGAYSFDLAAGAHRVPAGDYVLHRGQLGLGTTTVEVRQGRADGLTVEAGATRKLAWGGPARAEFQFARNGEEVVFSPDHVWYFGAAGEEYRNWHPVAKSPEFKIKREDSGEVLATAIFPGSC